MPVGRFEFLATCMFSYCKRGIASRTGLVFLLLSHALSLGGELGLGLGPEAGTTL